MSGFYKRAVVWLGLNEEYPEDVRGEVSASVPQGEVAEGDMPEAGEPRAERPGPAPQARPERPERAERPPKAEKSKSDNPLRYDASRDRSEGSVRVVPIDTPPSDRLSDSESVVASGSAGASGSLSGSSSRAASDMSTGTVRAVPMPATVKPELIVPQSFNDAQNVADYYKDGTPAIVNLQNAERDLARRLIDFSSGLCYGLGGQMEKVAKDVYLLIPSDVEVAEEDRTNY